MPRTRSLAKLVMMLTALARQSAGQTLYGSIIGTVTDSSGAGVSGAGITITQTSSGLVREAASDAAGRYSVSELFPGSYGVHFAKSEFRSWSQSGVQVSVNTITRVDAALELGPAAETITVMARTAIQARS